MASADFLDPLPAYRSILDGILWLRHRSSRLMPYMMDFIISQHRLATSDNQIRFLRRISCPMQFSRKVSLWGIPTSNHETKTFVKMKAPASTHCSRSLPDSRAESDAPVSIFFLNKRALLTNGSSHVRFS